MSMKIILIVLMLSGLHLASADEITKWTDEEGRVHYGDRKARIENPIKVETLQVDDTFDQKAYDDAMERNRETEQSLKEYQAERESQAKREREEAAANRPVAPAPAGGTTVVYPPAVYTGPGRPVRPGAGIGRPVPTPLPSGPVNRR
jgi:hypothetical protein